FVADHRFERARDPTPMERDAAQRPDLPLERHRRDRIARGRVRPAWRARGERRRRRGAEQGAPLHAILTGAAPVAVRSPARTAARAASETGTSPEEMSTGRYGTSASS